VVIHLANSSMIAKINNNPLSAFDNNVCGLIRLLDAINKSNCVKIIFLSSSAIYGSKSKNKIDERDNLSPISVYGETKLMEERIISCFSKMKELQYIIFRPCSVAGSSLDSSLGDNNFYTHLIPLLLSNTRENLRPFTIFGTNHDTSDGTPMREYVHVLDVVDALILSIDYIRKNKDNQIFNIGSENCCTVKELISKCSKIVGKDIPFQYGETRDGDPSKLILNSNKIKDVLKWQPKYDIDSMIKTQWDYMNKK
jgi:UDP-glucose 4-epimerase